MMNAHAADIAGEWLQLAILLNQPKSIWDLVLRDEEPVGGGQAQGLPLSSAALWPHGRRGR